MIKNYNAREQKLYADHHKKSDAELLSILEKRESYVSEFISIIEDILEERGLFKKTDNFEKTKINDVGLFIQQCIYEEKYSEQEIITLLVNQLNIANDQAGSILHAVYHKEKELLQIKYSFDPPKDNKSIALAVSLFILGILSSIYYHSVEMVASVLSIVIFVFYLLGLLYTLTYTKKLNKKRTGWIIGYLLFPCITLIFLAFTSYSHPANLQRKIDALKFGLKRQIKDLDRSAENYIEQKTNLEKAAIHEFYELLYNEYVFNNSDYEPEYLTPSTKVHENPIMNFDRCPACDFQVSSSDKICPDCGLKLV